MRLEPLASLPSEWRPQAEEVGQRLHIDPVDWYRTQDAPQHLHDVAAAMWASRPLGGYESAHGPVRREPEPLRLVLKAGAWYQAARCVGQDDARTYRLASIRALRGTGHAFKRPRRFDLARYGQESSQRFESESRRLQARVRISPRALTWRASGRLPFTSAESAQPAVREGWGEVLMAIESIEHGARQLLWFGAEVEVPAPPALHEDIGRQLRAMGPTYADAAFVADEDDAVKPIRVRATWVRITPNTCRWHQAVSRDGGSTWEPNRFTDWTRA